GPAALCATDGRWAVAGMDRNGLRPMRYTVTTDNLLVVGSETGMVPVPEHKVVKKGRVGPGEMIAVDLKKGRMFLDREIKDRLAAEQPYGEWVKNIVTLDKINDAPPASRTYTRDELRRHQLAFGLTLEDMELILHPMAEDAKEAIGSMGDDTPIAVLSEQYRGLHHFFRQQFSQVTNPPIDSLREKRVMSLRTRMGNLTNVLDEDAHQVRILLLESPVLSNADFAKVMKYAEKTTAWIDCTFDADGDNSGALRDALKRIRIEAENAVRGGAAHIVLSDEGMNAERAAIPMILATGAVHSHLVRQGLRTFTSLTVRSG